MLHCEHISVSGILDGISLTAARGSFTAVLGKNGSGKSTLLSCLAAQRECTGKITVCGETVKALPARERAKRIALLPQVLPSPSLTVRELVSLGRNPYLSLGGRMGTADLGAIEHALSRTEMQSFAARALSTLSGGEKQRAFLAMILAQDADVLLLDEPTTYMDVHAEAEFLMLLRALADAGKTLIVVLHDLTLAVRYADHILLLDGGKSVFCGGKKACIEAGAIEETFSVRRVNIDGETLFLA